MINFHLGRVSKIAIVKGVSGSGKSSRVFQVLKFFEKKYTPEPFYFTSLEGNAKEIGVLIKELNIVFLGKKYVSGNVERWQGYDSVAKAFGRSSTFSGFLQSNTQYIFIVEGASVTQTNRLRPIFLNQIGYTEMYIQYYNFPAEAKNEYHKRVILRNGIKPKKDTMWLKNTAFNKEVSMSVKEKLQLPETNVIVYNDLYNVSIYDFGLKFLKFAGMANLRKEFKTFVKEYDYTAKNSYANFQEKQATKTVVNNTVFDL